jgi:glycosyltransferase involved in cell wall biosynthesis
VPERDVYSLRKKIESLVLNRSKRKKMGVQGRKIAKKFSWEEVLKKYCFLIKYKNEK